jgi:L-alanine-DL-glutamate epimerase-like enolase superfamily enzyme
MERIWPAKRTEIRQGRTIFSQGDPEEVMADIYTLIRRLQGNNVKILLDAGAKWNLNAEPSEARKLEPSDGPRPDLCIRSQR